MAENWQSSWRSVACTVVAFTGLASSALAQAPPPPPLTPAPMVAPPPALTPAVPSAALVPPPSPSAPPPAAAPPTLSIPVLRIGILAARNAEYSLRQAEPFRLYLEGQIGTRVEIVAMRDYAALIDAQIDSLVQYAVYSASAFVTAEALCSCVEPIAAPADADGAQGFYSILLARADGPIATLEDARGSRLALVAGDSIAGRLIPLDALPLAGAVPAEHFAAIVDVASPEAAVAALLGGEVDVAVAWSSLSGDPVAGFGRGVLTQMVGEGALAMDQLRIVWRSELIPYGPHAIRSDLPAEVKAALAAALAGISADNPAAVDAIDQSGVTGFVAPDPRLYDPLRRLVAAADTPAAP